MFYFIKKINEYKSGNEVLSDKEWFEAINNNDIELIKKYINLGYDVNTLNKGGKSSLILATYFGKHEMVKELLKVSNIDINYQLSDTKYSALIYAVLFNHWRVVKELISNSKININLPDSLLNTPLIYSIKYIQQTYHFLTQCESFKLLLTHPDIDINKVNLNKESVLIIATKENKVEVVELLLKQPNINIYLENYKGLSALDFAVRNNFKKIEKLLRDRIYLDEKRNNINEYKNESNKFSNKKWFNAIRDNKIKLIREYIGGGFDINCTDDAGDSALINACFFENLEVVKELLSYSNVNINHQDNNKVTALMWACEKNNEKIVKELLKHPNIDLNLTDIHGNSALYYTNIYHRWDIKYLLKKAGAIE